MGALYRDVIEGKRKYCVAEPLRKKVGARAIIKVSGYQHWWLAGGYDLEIEIFRGG